MPECTIRLVSNPKTGKRDIHIDYTSEADALPHEHEADHRALVKEVLGEDIFDQDDVGQLVVSRGEAEEVGERQRTEAPSHRDKAAEGQEG